MPLPLFWVDAFTDHAFGGNPAGVMPLEAWPEDAQLRRLAAENNLPATAFMVRTGSASAEIRWFTPTLELELCGHATLATGFILATELGQAEWPVTLHAPSGRLTVRRRGTRIELDFPARPASASVAPPELLQGLGREPREVLRTDKTWMCVYADEAEVRTLRPDDAVLGRVLPGRIIVTAPGDQADFVSRFFAPEVGIAEDAVTGSSHCTLVPYWAARLRQTELHARQLSRRGGELWCELRGDRVGLAGHCALYLRGQVNA